MKKTIIHRNVLFRDMTDSVIHSKASFHYKPRGFSFL